MTSIIEGFKDPERRPVVFFLSVTALCAISIMLSTVWHWIEPAVAR